jgi:hypothetical protein
VGRKDAQGEDTRVGILIQGEINAAIHSGFWQTFAVSTAALKQLLYDWL